MPYIFDHLAIAADNLQQGVAFIKDKLGVEIPFGGEHDQMGTHNHLMQIGDGIFLEIIAINPNAKPPLAPQKRWFDLDNPKLQQQLKQQPALVNWIARTDNLQQATTDFSEDLGKIHNVTRGALNWQITIPEDGHLNQNGLCPLLIEWQKGLIPANNMTNLGVKLKTLTLSHPNPTQMQKILEDYIVSNEFDLKIVKGDYNLAAQFTTANGDLVSL